MAYYRRRAANDKQYYRDKWIMLFSILGFLFILFALMATAPLWRSIFYSRLYYLLVIK